MVEGFFFENSERMTKGCKVKIETTWMERKEQEARDIMPGEHAAFESLFPSSRTMTLRGQSSVSHWAAVLLAEKGRHGQRRVNFASSRHITARTDHREVRMPCPKEGTGIPAVMTIGCDGYSAVCNTHDRTL